MLSPRVPSFVDVEVATGGQDQLRERRIAWWLGIPMRDGECAESIAVNPQGGGISASSSHFDLTIRPRVGVHRVATRGLGVASRRSSFMV